MSSLNRKIFTVIGLSLLLLSFNCKSAKSVNEDSKDLATLERILQNKSYRIDMIAVYPFNTAATQNVFNNVLVNRQGDNASRIDVNGEGYYIQFKDSIAIAELPYFGEQRFAGSRFGGGDVGIKYNSEAKNYSITEHKRKDALVVKFDINDRVDTAESYNIIMTVFPSGTTDVVIVSSHRTGNNYRGTIVEIE